MSKAYDDMVEIIDGVDAKIRALQARLEAGGMSAEEEASVKAKLSVLSQVADPTQPNPS